MPNVSKVRMRSINMAKMKILKNKALVVQQTAVNSTELKLDDCTLVIVNCR